MHNNDYGAFELETVAVGIFWIANDEKKSIVWDKINRPKKGSGFINYESGHFDKWAELSLTMHKGMFRHHDCYYFPRGRVLYDCATGKTLVYADQKILDRLANFEMMLADIYQLKDYEFRTDEHYRSAAKFK